MALHGNDQSHFSRGEGVTSDNSLLNNTASLFHNVNIGSHMSTYPLDPYNHQNTSFILRSFSNRSDLTLPHCYAIGPENNSDNNHIAGGGDFPPRPSTSHTNNPSDGSAHDIFGDRSQGTAGHVVRTRRRKAGGDDGTSRLCVVCEEPASGYNFDRLTCESCKAFFRRNALKPKDKIKACSRNGDCVVVGSQRKHCPSCRLEKCLAVGMKKELILPPEKLEQRAKPKRRRQNTNTDEASTSGPGPSTIMPFGTHGGGGGFSQPPTLHPQVANLVGSRVPPSQFGPSEAHDFMSTRNLNNVSG
nr:nuclear receptor subfamily 1 group I member [Hymenolepis microstoma]